MDRSGRIGKRVEIPYGPAAVRQVKFPHTPLRTAVFFHKTPLPREGRKCKDTLQTNRGLPSQKTCLVCRNLHLLRVTVKVRKNKADTGVKQPGCFAFGFRYPHVFFSMGFFFCALLSNDIPAFVFCTYSALYKEDSL